MPSHGVPIALTTMFAELRRDLARASRAASRHATGMEQPFSMDGALTVATSQPWTPRMDVYLSEVRCLLGTVGGGTTVVEVDVNGTSIGSGTLSAANTLLTITPTALAADTDLVTVKVTTADATAKDLTVLVRLN